MTDKRRKRIDRATDAGKVVAGAGAAIAATVATAAGHPELAVGARLGGAVASRAVDSLGKWFLGNVGRESGRRFEDLMRETAAALDHKNAAALAHSLETANAQWARDALMQSFRTLLDVLDWDAALPVIALITADFIGNSTGPTSLHRRVAEMVAEMDAPEIRGMRRLFREIVGAEARWRGSQHVRLAVHAPGVLLVYSDGNDVPPTGRPNAGGDERRLFNLLKIHDLAADPDPGALGQDVPPRTIMPIDVAQKLVRFFAPKR